MHAVADIRPNRALWRLGAAIAYPILVWSAIGFDAEWLRALTLPLLGLAVIGGLPNTLASAALFTAALALAFATLIAPEIALWPAGLICLALAGWFARSLAGGDPLIRRFAMEVCRQADRALPPRSGAWFRMWTLIWSLLLAALGAGALVLAVLDRQETWLIWVSGVMPTSCLLAFLAEFYLRPLRFPGEARMGLVDFIIHLGRVRPERLAR